MRPSTGLRAQAERVLAQAMEQLDEDLQRRLIDEPIDRAAASLKVDRCDHVGHETFHRVVAEVAQHLHREGLGVHCCLSSAQAQAAGVFFLQHIYQGVADSGYEAAVVDGRLRQDGLRLLVYHLVDSVKAWQRGVHKLWVKVRIVGELDWEGRCILAAILLEKLAPYFPENVRSMEPAWFADDPLKLLDMISSTTPAALLSQTGLR